MTYLIRRLSDLRFRKTKEKMFRKAGLSKYANRDFWRTSINYVKWSQTEKLNQELINRCIIWRHFLSHRDMPIMFQKTWNIVIFRIFRSQSWKDEYAEQKLLVCLYMFWLVEELNQSDFWKSFLHYCRDQTYCRSGQWKG